MTPHAYVPTIDRATLVPLARAATAYPDLQIDAWQTTCLSVQGRRHIFRVAGVGHAGVAARPWSLILKVIRAPEHAHAPDTDILNWVYWEREYQLYANGIPQMLTGALRAPHCYGVAQPDGALRWIWLEDLRDHYDRVWPPERYVLAARHLGAFNGAYRAGTPMPSAPWLGGNRLRSRSADAIADVARLRDPAVWAHPRLRRVFPHPVLAALEHLLADRERFLAVAARLPHTFCHHDAWQGNMAALHDGDGAETTVLFDWAIAGYGPVGAEIANLVWSSLLEFKLDVHAAARLEAVVVDSYLQGLAEAGWHADPHEVRCAYLIAAVLIFGLVPEAVDHALNEHEHAALERTYGWPINRLIEQAADVTYLLLERADELRTLVATMPTRA